MIIDSRVGKRKTQTVSSQQASSSWPIHSFLHTPEANGTFYKSLLSNYIYKFQICSNTEIHFSSLIFFIQYWRVLINGFTEGRIPIYTIWPEGVGNIVDS